MTNTTFLSRKQNTIKNSLYICNMDEKEKLYRTLRYLIYFIMIVIALCVIVPLVYSFYDTAKFVGF